MAVSFNHRDCRDTFGEATTALPTAINRRNRFSIGNPDKSDFYRRVYSIENVSLIEFLLYVGNLIRDNCYVYTACDYVLKNIWQHGLIEDFSSNPK